MRGADCLTSAFPGSPPGAGSAPSLLGSWNQTRHYYAAPLPPVSVGVQEGGAENGLGVAVAEELQRHKAHPILYLLDLPESIEFSASQSGLNDAFKTLLRECRGLRCPGCGEEANACMALPS